MAKAKAAAESVDLHALGARVVSVFGPFAAKTLILLPTDKAAAMFPDPLALSGVAAVTEAIARDLAEIAKHAPDLADSTLAATAQALALELDHPFNSATSKSMCAKALMDALEQLRALMPVREEGDDVDDLVTRRAARRAGIAAAAHPARS
jgi:hypothetical protein